MGTKKTTKAKQEQAKQEQGGADRLQETRALLVDLNRQATDRDAEIKALRLEARRSVSVALSSGKGLPGSKAEDIAALEADLRSLRESIGFVTEALPVLELQAHREAIADLERDMEPLRDEHAKAESELKKAERRRDDAVNALAWRRDERNQRRHELRQLEERIVARGGPAADMILQEREAERGPVHLVTITNPDGSVLQQESIFTQAQHDAMQNAILAASGAGYVRSQEHLETLEGELGQSRRIHVAGGASGLPATDDNASASRASLDGGEPPTDEATERKRQDARARARTRTRELQGG